jgi:hypothetical protein
VKLNTTSIGFLICIVLIIAFIAAQTHWARSQAYEPPATTVAVTGPELLPVSLVTAYLAGMEDLEKSIVPGQEEVAAANEFELVSDLEVLRTQIAALRKLGQQIQDGTAGPAEHKRFREIHEEFKTHERHVLAAINTYQAKQKTRYEDNASTMGYAGIDFSLSMRDFNQRYANKTGTAEHDPATDACTFTLKNLGPARYSEFEFVDQDLCKINFAYLAPSWDEFGGAQGIAQRMKDRLGPATQTKKVDGLTIGLWEFPERRISLGVNDETAVVQIIHLPREAKRLARQAVAEKARERKVLTRDAGF